MTTNQKIKKYLENHPGSTIKDWENQRHRMYIIQASKVTFSKHTGSKNIKTLKYHMNSIANKVNTFNKYAN